MLKYWNRYHHSIWSGILLLIRTVAGFGAQKVVAVFYGPSGTTLFSHFQNLVALFTQPIQDAVANGLINAFPKKSLEKTQVIGASIIISILIATSTGLFLLIMAQFGQSIFTFSLQNWLLVIPCIVLFCFGLIVSAVYVIQKKLKLYSIILLIQWSIFFLSVGLLDFELNQFLSYWLFIQSLFAIVLIIPVYSYLQVGFKIDKKVKNHFKQFVIMGLAVWLSSKWVDYFIREFAVQEFGTMQTGLWQSIVRISGAYRGLVVSFLFLSLYPMLSQILAEGNFKKSNFRKYFLWYLLFSFSFLFIVFQSNEFILTSLYDIQYSGAGNLFQYQIIGDVFAFLAFPFSIYLIASVKTKTYIVTELLSAVVFVVLIVLNTDTGIEILVYAHIIRFMFFSVMVSFIGLKGLSNVS